MNGPHEADVSAESQLAHARFQQGALTAVADEDQPSIRHAFTNGGQCLDGEIGTLLGFKPAHVQHEWPVLKAEGMQGLQTPLWIRPARGSCLNQFLIHRVGRHEQLIRRQALRDRPIPAGRPVEHAGLGHRGGSPPEPSSEAFVMGAESVSPQDHGWTTTFGKCDEQVGAADVPWKHHGIEVPVHRLQHRGLPDDATVLLVGGMSELDSVTGGDAFQAAHAATQISPDLNREIGHGGEALEDRPPISGHDWLNDADSRCHPSIVSHSLADIADHSTRFALNQAGAASNRPAVVVIYHFYPHYRKPVVEALARSDRASFTFVGDDHEYLHSVEPARLSPDVRFHRAPTHHLFGPFMWQWGAIRWAVSSRFDTVIMHAVPHWPCTWIGGLAARLLGKRVFFWGHGYLSRPRGLKGLIRRLFYAIPTDHLFYSRLAKAYAIEAGWPPERVHVIYNSVDATEQHRIRRAWSPEQGRQLRERWFGDASVPVIGCTSRLIPMRRLHELLEAVKTLHARGIQANVLLVGDGPERARLEALARALDVRVHFAGACYDESRLGPMIMACHVTVSPGKTGLTAVHSIGYGVPVVSHDDPDDQGPEWEAILPGRTGSLFRRGDVRSLASAIEPWIRESKRDPSVEAACVALYDRFWNPEYQRRAIERAVCGDDADDLMIARGNA